VLSQLSPVEILVIAISLYFIVFLGHTSSLYFFRWRERIFRRRMIEEFIDNLQSKIQTEEDFNEIVKRFRKDFGNEQ
jgi:hypothetical protein